MLSVGATDPSRFHCHKTKDTDVNTKSLKQTLAGALLAVGIMAAGLLGAGTGDTSTLYGSSGCPVGHYCGVLGR